MLRILTPPIASRQFWTRREPHTSSAITQFRQKETREHGTHTRREAPQHPFWPSKRRVDAAARSPAPWFAGYRVLIVTGSPDAHKLCANPHEHIDYLLTDLLLPPPGLQLAQYGGRFPPVHGHTLVMKAAALRKDLQGHPHVCLFTGGAIRTGDHASRPPLVAQTVQGRSTPQSGATDARSTAAKPGDGPFQIDRWREGPVDRLTSPDQIWPRPAILFHPVSTKPCA